MSKRPRQFANHRNEREKKHIHSLYMKTNRLHVIYMEIHFWPVYFLINDTSVALCHTKIHESHPFGPK